MLSIRLATVGLAAVALFGGTASAQWWVSPTGSDANSGTFANPFQTINYAAGLASNGDTINLKAGVFGDEQGIVILGAKNLVIVGQGQGVSVIQAHTSDTVTRDGGFLTSPVASIYRPVVLVEGTSLVQFRNLTLDGNHSLPSSGRLYGLFLRGGADARLDRVSIENCRTDPIDSNQRPAGVVVRGDNAIDSTKLEMVRCLIQDFGKSGVVTMFNSDVIMDTCNVDGEGHITALAQNGIQVSYGSTGTLRNNTVTDIFYSPQTTSAAGILGFGAGDLSITDNYIGNCEAGIFISSTAPTTVVGEIRGNDTVAARASISMENVSGYSISGNVCHILSDDFPAAFDNSNGGNDWESNSYSDFTGVNPFAIVGGTTDVDTNARGGVNEFGAAIVTALPMSAAESMASLDLNGDALGDFVVGNSSGAPTLTVGTGTGNGLFSLVTLPFGNPNGIVTAVVRGEFNGIVGDDVAVFTRNVPPNTGENKVYVFINDGSGNLSLAHVETLAVFASGSNMASGDLDGDMLDDLVVTDAGSPPLINGKAFRLINQGGGVLWNVSILPVPSTRPARGADIADADGDGINDVVIVMGDTFLGQYFVLKGFNNGAFTPIASGVTNLNPREVIIDDIDGDGDSDFIVAAFRFGLDFGSVEVFENDGFNAWTKTQVLVDQGPVAIATGDVDNDTGVGGSRRDVAVASFVAGNTTLLGRYNVTGFSSGGIADRTGSPIGVAIGEFTGDAFSDLLIIDASSQQARVLPGRSSSVAELYGDGCPGLNGLIPTLVAIGLPPLPVQPNPTFGLRIENARANTVAVFAAGLTPQPVLIPCQLMIDNIIDTWWELTNATGKASISVPIPPTPALAGAELFMQAGAFDPANTTAFVPGFSLTPGMRLRVGFY